MTGRRARRRSRPMSAAAASRYQPTRPRIAASSPGQSTPRPCTAQNVPKLDSSVPTSSCSALRGMRWTTPRASRPAPATTTKAAAAPSTALGSAWAVRPKLTTMNATSKPSSSTPLNDSTNAVQSTPWAGTPSAGAARSPMPRKPPVLTLLMPLRSHCRPKTSSSEPITRRSASIGTARNAVPKASTSTASTASPAPPPSQVDRQPRTLPTPTTMITISMTSTAAARKVVTKTEELLTATSLRAPVSLTSWYPPCGGLVDPVGPP
jgi:hypothetical protein